MIDRNRFIEEYRGSPPPMLNRKLRGIYELIPSPVDLYPQDAGGFRLDMSTEELRRWKSSPITDQIMADLDERKALRTNSIVVQTLVVRHEVLVSFGYVTPAFREYSTIQYRDSLIEGVIREPIPIIGSDFDRFTERFGWSDSQDGGIFDPDQGRQLDQAAYRGAARERIYFAQELRDISGEENIAKEWENYLLRKRQKKKSMTEDEAFDYELDLQRMDNFYKPWIEAQNEEEALVRRWRQEHIELFGQEP